jgi:hypothetical protein
MAFFESSKKENHQNDFLIVDSSNIMFRSFLALNATDLELDDITPGLLHHSLFGILFKYYNLYKPKKILMVFDRPSWRKLYTSDSELCKSGLPYKGNRRKNLTVAEALKFERLFEYMAIVESTLREVTSLVCFAGEGLEADDIIAGLVQQNMKAKIVILSGDKDLIQLLHSEDIKLVDPATGKQRYPETDDLEFFIFNKCFRGDTGDNVSTAYPRLRSTKIQKAFTDPYEFTNLMCDSWTNKDGKSVTVKEMYAENQLLMDLSKQPDCVRNNIDDCIEHSFANVGKFTLFTFLKFCGRYKLDKVKERIETYAPMLSM